jgi:amidase
MAEVSDWLDATEQCDLVRSASVTAGELAEAAIAHIEERNPAINAVTVPLYEYGLAAAADPHLPRGLLHGVPFLLKDAGACLAGLPRFAGSGLLRDLGASAEADTSLGSRMRAAGLVVIGKSNLPEFGCQPTTQPVAFGATRNPWDVGRSAGGSSGGAAAAVAAGLVAIAHASDIGGSIRIPAAWCGVVGLKPSRGRTTTAPIIDPNLVEHVITRSLRDTALALDAFSGSGPTDPYSLDPPPEPYVKSLERDPGRLRIGVATSVSASAIDVDATCVAGANQLAESLEQHGHVVESRCPSALCDDAFLEHHFTSSARELSRMLDGLAASIGRPLTPADVEAFTWAMAATGAAIDDATYAASQTWERAYTARVTGWWADYDLLVTPSTGEPPARLEELVPDPAEPLAILPRFQRIWAFAAPFNVTGQPAITLPVFRERDVRPTGVQLVAALGREDLLLQVAAQLETLGAWRTKRPSIGSTAAS